VADRLTVRSLGTRAEGQPDLFEWKIDPPGPGQMLLRTLHSGVSAGTELAVVKGTAPKFGLGWDGERCLFTPGPPAKRYPVPVMGYMEVAAVGTSNTDRYRPGQLVAAAYGHVSAHVADPSRDLVVPLPTALDPLLGIYVAQMGPIAANGLLHAAAEERGDQVSSLGDGVRGKRVVVVGAGVVGLLVALFAIDAEALEVVVVDPTSARRRAAEALGCDAVDEAGLPTRIKDRWRHGPGDRGADVVFQCRGRAASLHAALASLRPQGTVIDLAFYQGPATDVRLGEEFHHNGLTIRCAQIGRVPRRLEARWDRCRLASETIRLLLTHGRALRRALEPVVVPLADAPGLLRDMATVRRDVIQAVVEFTENGHDGDGAAAG
jgi:threonine dehydrogenase-like Zn-dependent dehydrogenase